MSTAGRSAGVRVGGLLAAAALGLLAVLAFAVPASAHAVLERTDPPSGTVVAQAPDTITLTFSEDVSLVPGKVTVSGPDGKPAGRGEPTHAGREVRIPLRTDGARGTYLVSYRVISADSHPVSGSFTFSVGAPSATPPRSDSTGERIDPVVSVAMSAARYLGYAGLVLLVGPAVVLGSLWPRRISRRDPTRLATAGLGLIVLGAVAELYLQAPYTTGTGLFDASGSALTDVLDSRYGTAHLVRIGAVLAAGFLLRPYLAGRGGRADQVLLLLLAAVAAVTWPLGGHPVASPLPPLTVVADAVHLAAMAFWLGGLVMLVGFLLRRASAGELGAILPVWSRWALVSVIVLVLAGGTQALVELGTPSALWETTYGRLLLLKGGLLAVIVAVAALSRALVQRMVDRPRPDTAAGPEPGGVGASPAVRRGLTRSVFVELAIAVVVLGATSALVQTTPARTAEASRTRTEADQFPVTLDTPVASIQVDVDPAETGNNTVHLYAYTKQGQPQQVVEWRVTAALPARGIEPLDVSVLAITDNHAVGQVNLPEPGDWEFSFTVRTSEIDQGTATRTIRIK